MSESPDDRITEMRTQLSKEFADAIHGEFDMTVTPLSDTAAIVEAKAQLRPQETPNASQTQDNDRIALAFSAEVVIQGLAKIVSAQHWRHPDIEITGRVQHRDDGTTELVSEGHVRVYLLVSLDGDGDQEDRRS